MVGGFGPDEGFRILVVVVDEMADGVLQLQRAAMNAAAKLFLRQLGEPAFDQIQPGGRGGSEVQVEARALGQPTANELSFVRAIVVQDEMHIEVWGDVALDGIEEAAELTGAMPAMHLAEHLAAGYVESGEQAGGAVANVVVAAAFDLSRAHGQQRSGAIQRLNLAFFVHAQDQGAVGRVEVEADDVADFVDKQRIAAEFEGSAALRLQRKGAPDAADARLAEPAGLGEGARGPMGRSLRLGFQGTRQHAFHLGIAQAAGGAGTGLIEQSIEAETEKTLPPLADRGPGDVQAAGHFGVAEAGGAEQDDAGAQGQSLRRLGTARPVQQRLAFGGKQSQRRERTTKGHAVPPAYIRCRKTRYLFNEY